MVNLSIDKRFIDHERYVERHTRLIGTLGMGRARPSTRVRLQELSRCPPRHKDLVRHAAHVGAPTREHLHVIEPDSISDGIQPNTTSHFTFPTRAAPGAYLSTEQSYMSFELDMCTRVLRRCAGANAHDNSATSKLCRGPGQGRGVRVAPNTGDPQTGVPGAAQ